MKGTIAGSPLTPAPARSKLRPMVRRLPSLPAVWATACQLVLVLALLWQASGASAMALMGCCLAPQPCCVAVVAPSHCVVCAPAAVVASAPQQPATVSAGVVVAVDLQTRRWVEPVHVIWRPPVAQQPRPTLQYSHQLMRFT